jgi:regulator of PEP synthase PpsR (kinase-PPPase family)
MIEESREGPTQNPPAICIVSGASGASGEQLVETVLAQFPNSRVSLIKMTHTRQREQITEIVENASDSCAIIVHTLVDKTLREFLIAAGKKAGVVTIDLMGPLINQLSRIFGEEPLGQPGLYRQLRKSYFDRVEAIEFTMSHDDGLNPQDLPAADIVLIGVSRSGKTPLSMYLAVLGWKVANVPVLVDVPFPSQLFKVDRHRIFGLDIEYNRLLNHRRKRQARFGYSMSSYTNPKTIFEEIETATQIYKKYGFTVIGVTNKPMETSADEIIEKMTQRFKVR